MKTTTTTTTTNFIRNTSTRQQSFMFNVPPANRKISSRWGKVKKEKEILMLLETKNKTENKTKKHNECKKINQISKFLIKYIQYITHYITSKV